MANLMPEVARMLGVEIGEKFQINLCPNVLFKFDMSGILAQEQGEASWHSANRGILQELIYGSFEIMKLPWKPRKGDVFYSFYKEGVAVLFGYAVSESDDCVWKVTECYWNDSPLAIALYKAGWVYRTREEAENALPDVAKELGVEYKL